MFSPKRSSPSTSSSMSSRSRTSSMSSSNSSATSAMSSLPSLTGGDDAATGVESAALSRPRLRVGEGEDCSLVWNIEILYHCEGVGEKCGLVRLVVVVGVGGVPDGRDASH